MANKKNKKDNFPGYPLYPESEDIFNNNKEETEIDPENLKATKAPNEKRRSLNEKNFKDDVSGGDLDIPGSELDDDMENIGSEDEENNYYSLGGDNDHDSDGGMWE